MANRYWDAGWECGYVGDVWKIDLCKIYKLTEDEVSIMSDANAKQLALDTARKDFPNIFVASPLTKEEFELSRFRNYENEE